MARFSSVAELAAYREEIAPRFDPKRTCIAVCVGPGCLAYKSGKIADAFQVALEQHGLTDTVALLKTGCHGFCQQGPSVVIHPKGIAYLKVAPADAAEIVETTLVNDGLVERLLYKGKDGSPIAEEKEIPFYKLQTPEIFGTNRFLDPLSIDNYIALGGYKALAKALSAMTPDEVVAEVKKSNLRGRGGAGFPAGRKWEGTRRTPAPEKYVIVNADEGDPGAYMDRGILEGNPHSVLEGLLIGGYAIGSEHGFVYVRQEYPLAVEALYLACDQMREMGLLGENILGTGFNFEVVIHRGAGAFVSGESSALMSSIEGRVGEPRPKYVRTSIKGVRGMPSNLNNVETWANVPLIIDKGADWFTSIGTDTSKGTKIFSLVGKVNNTGLVEVPMGTTLRKIIFDIGGGLPVGKKFKAVQTGGPSGGVIPENQLDLPVDFDRLKAAGSMMGSGGMIVMDQDTCMVDVARYFLEFLADESCGKCVPCREGITQMLHILRRLCKGEGRTGDIEALEDIADTVLVASLCALGQSAPNPVLSSIKYFREEYVAHVEEKRCPACMCKTLTQYWIDPAKCIACGKCLRECPVNAISGEKKVVHVIDQDKCTKCDTCYQVCPAKVQAVTKLSGQDVPAPPADLAVGAAKADAEAEA